MTNDTRRPWVCYHCNLATQSPYLEPVRIINEFTGDQEIYYMCPTCYRFSYYNPHTHTWGSVKFKEIPQAIIERPYKLFCPNCRQLTIFTIHYHDFVMGQCTCCGFNFSEG